MASLPIPKPDHAGGLHVAIIMDGSRRWASRQGLPPGDGLRAGAEAVQRVVGAAPGLGITHLTLFAFPPENRRAAARVEDSTDLLHLFLGGGMDALEQNRGRLRVLGGRDRFPDAILALIDHAERRTAGNTGLTLTFALDYGGRQEIMEAVRRVLADVMAGGLAVDAIDERTLAVRLEAPDLPDPDLVIRTGGRRRVSNFLLWQMAYAEFVFTETPWPVFSAANLADAVAEYQGRDRRYGGV